MRKYNNSDSTFTFHSFLTIPKIKKNLETVFDGEVNFASFDTNIMYVIQKLKKRHLTPQTPHSSFSLNLPRFLSKYLKNTKYKHIFFIKK